jgi:hypothetical protein
MPFANAFSQPSAIEIAPAADGPPARTGRKRPCRRTSGRLSTRRTPASGMTHMSGCIIDLILAGMRCIRTTRAGIATHANRTKPRARGWRPGSRRRTVAEAPRARLPSRIAQTNGRRSPARAAAVQDRADERSPKPRARGCRPGSRRRTVAEAPHARGWRASAPSVARTPAWADRRMRLL